MEQPTASTTLKNPKPAGEPKVKGPQMNDRDRLNDCLAMEKYLTDSLNVAVREASHADLHAEVMTILTETHQAARDLFNEMFRQGWYSLEAEERSKVEQISRQFAKYATQFPYDGQTH